MPDINRILVVRTDRLGDVVLTLPLFPILRRRFPQAYLAMLLRRYAGALVEGDSSIDGMIWYDDEHGIIPFGRMLRTLREGKFDACVVVHPTGRLARLMCMAGIPVRVGSGYRVYSLLFNRRVYTHRKTAERHEAEYNVELLTKLDCVIPSPFIPGFSIEIPPAVQRRVEDILAHNGIGAQDRFAVLHPGSGGSAREWPPESFGDLATILAEKHGLKVVVTGDGREAEVVKTVVTRTGGDAIGLAGAFTLKELAALVRTSALFVSNSTGPLHVAVAVGTPVLGLYPQIPVMGPKRWGPFTRNARVLVPDRPLDCRLCIGNSDVPCACMASIPVALAADAAAQLLISSTPILKPSLHDS